MSDRLTPNSTLCTTICARTNSTRTGPRSLTRKHSASTIVSARYASRTKEFQNLLSDGMSWPAFSHARKNEFKSCEMGFLACFRTISSIAIANARYRNCERREPRLRRGISSSLASKSSPTGLALSLNRLVGRMHVTYIVCSSFAVTRACGGRSDAARGPNTG